MSFSAFLLIPALASAPFATLETQELDKTDINNFRVSVRAIDGKAYLGKRDDINLTAEAHFIVMTAIGSTKYIAKRNFEKSLYINPKPCFRYFVTGQKKSEVSSDWEVRVLGSERIKSCKTEGDAKQQKQDPTTKPV